MTDCGQGVQEQGGGAQVSARLVANTVGLHLGGEGPTHGMVGICSAGTNVAMPIATQPLSNITSSTH